MRVYVCDLCGTERHARLDGRPPTMWTPIVVGKVRRKGGRVTERMRFLCTVCTARMSRVN